MSFEVFISYFIFSIIIFILTYKIICQQCLELRGNGKLYSKIDGNGKIYSLGRGSEDEEIEVILQRIYWSTYLRKRTSIINRTFLMTILISIGIILSIYTIIPPVIDIIIIIIVIFVLSFMFNNFMYVHGDIHNDGNIRNNIKLLAKKMNLKLNLNKDPLPPSVDALDRLDIE